MLVQLQFSKRMLAMTWEFLIYWRKYEIQAEGKELEV